MGVLHTVTLKRRRDDEDEDEEPFAGSNRGSKRRRDGKEPESTSAPKEKTSKSTGMSKERSKSHQKSTGKSAQAEEPIHADKDLEEPAHQEFEDLLKINLLMRPLSILIGFRNQQNLQLLTVIGTRLCLLNMDHLTFELMKGSYKSMVELEYFLEEVCKPTTDQLDWNNLEGQQYPHDLRKPLPLIPNSRGHRVIPFDHFINNDLTYLSGGVSRQTYATSVMKTKATNYGHIKWMEDLLGIMDFYNLVLLIQLNIAGDGYMRMEQYLTHFDYALWEVIVNSDAPAIASASTEGPVPPKTAEQKLARKNELKAKSTLLLAIPDEYLLKFHGIKDAKTL
ncbi:hypothetical protein Tco_1300458 [Tanacetum coccineum]